MKNKAIYLMGALLISILLAGCSQEPSTPADAVSVAELLEQPVYETQTRVYGEVSALGELFCTCFVLQSGGQTLQVWYDTMVEDSGAVRPAVDIQAIQNGDWVVVSGELKSGGIHYSNNDFWAEKIEVLP